MLIWENGFKLEKGLNRKLMKLIVTKNDILLILLKFKSQNNKFR